MICHNINDIYYIYVPLFGWYYRFYSIILFFIFFYLFIFFDFFWFVCLVIWDGFFFYEYTLSLDCVKYYRRKGCLPENV